MMRTVKTHDWVKKLGQYHLYVSGVPTTLCSMPMLGNNYASSIEPADRHYCFTCFDTKVKYERGETPEPGSEASIALGLEEDDEPVSRWDDCDHTDTRVCQGLGHG